ncbi:MAG TPA: hypothetical protein VNJ11_01430 [Bryobacteraceae bacterium]|nr:hypothetical protein [Bryobacteraceae bacterium]
MKTTVDLPDELLIAAKKRAAEERLTLRELLARGLIALDTHLLNADRAHRV